MAKKKRTLIPGTKVRPLPPHKLSCLLVGDRDDPVVTVIYDDHKQDRWDSGYLLLTTSAPDSPEEATEDDATTLCLHCLGKSHPEAERGLILAKAYGEAYWDDDEGEWIAEDDEGNEVLFDSGDEVPE